MKNSQYVNQANVGISDIFRIQFNEITFNSENIEVGTFSMHIDCAEAVAKTILQTIEQHKENVRKQQENLNTDKKLS